MLILYYSFLQSLGRRWISQLSRPEPFPNSTAWLSDKHGIEAFDRKLTSKLRLLINVCIYCQPLIEGEIISLL